MHRLNWLLLFPVLITIHGLVTAAPWLLRPTPGLSPLPLGNLAAWSSMLCLAGFVWLRRPRGALRRAAQLGGLAALAWGFVGYFWSGNWRFSFQGSDGLGPWISLSVAIAVVLLLNVVWSLVSASRRGKE
ncbi:MAG: hypothetical protein AAGH19_05175 [Pseudomonadota bacterium]